MAGVPTLLTVIGTRPQYIKYAAMTGLLRAHFREILVDTGQHYDRGLSEQFLLEFALPAPDHTLSPGAAAPAVQLARMLADLHEIMHAVRPDVLLCFGDTTSTLAAALAAVKNGIPVIHIEAGERNFSIDEVRIPAASTPEESNRVATDHLSTLCVTASQRAFSNLIAEHVTGNVYHAGDIMYDLFLRTPRDASRESAVLSRYGIESGAYQFCTIHRAINTDNQERLQGILDAVAAAEQPTVLPLHPRTRARLQEFGLWDTLARDSSLRIIDPVGYSESLTLSRHAALVLTDSGGVMREAYFAGVRSVCLDDTTAWIDIVHSGWSALTGADRDSILRASSLPEPDEHPEIFGDGHACARTVDAMRAVFG